MKVKNIVLIDDDEDEFLLFADAIKSIDNSIQLQYVSGPITTPCGKECTLPELAFLDINMPHRDGFEWLKWLREKNYTVPVVMYSTSKSNEKIALSYQLGANLYLTKPLEFKALLRSLQTILEWDWSQPDRIRSHYYTPEKCRSFSLVDK